ncbi:uncharacterized protein [Rutidosis leptorrhynchoides]|uniref:uncharacterized protein n=1 Tax=Rutidosis leptorrhynchoides TaxID=125765 RepID=UPI003A99C345
MVESKNNNSVSKTNSTVDSKTNNADLKHNNSCILKNNNKDHAKTNPDHDSKTNADASDQGDGSSGGTLSPDDAVQPSDNQQSVNCNKIFIDLQVYKSGPLFLSSKGIGWTSWKKRWFVLTQTSLVFFRSDPNAASQRGGEVNLTLGGIDLNSSGSVVVKADKKLLTVSFPDGRDGRAFTLKAETTEDLNGWKAALEEALENAPTVSPKAGTLKNDNTDTAADGSAEQPKEGSQVISKIVGRPVLLALEDIDGTPSFLEKALRYVEDHGVDVEGILRQAADVEDVERRIQEYEQGKVEFTAEDAHVIGDCIKYILREMPSSPVPASCCSALLDAYRTDRNTRVSAMRAAICDTFPEPNRRLLQRILIMMETVAENKTVNRMSVSAVAACMAPLLLRPLLAGECNLDSQFNMGGDGSAQLMQAAAAANHAQAIVIALLEEYDNIFGEGDMLSDPYSDSEELGSGSEELSEDEIYEEVDEEDSDYSSEGSNEDSEKASTSSHSADDRDVSQKNIKPTQKSGPIRSRTIAHRATDDAGASRKLLASSHVRSVSQAADMVPSLLENVQVSAGPELTDKSHESSTTTDSQSNIQHDVSNETHEKKELLNVEEKEESEKKALEERRLQLEQDVARLEEQLRKELELRKKLETGIKISQQALFSHYSTNDKTENKDGSEKPKFQSFSSSLPPHQHSSKETYDSKECDEKHNYQSQSTKIPPSHQYDSTKDMKKSSSSRPRRLNSRNETTGAMSKITNGLNFLKERSNQIADELQIMNRDRNKSQLQRHARKGSQDEIESQPQHVDSHTDKGRKSDEQSSESVHDVDPHHR